MKTFLIASLALVSSLVAAQSPPPQAPAPSPPAAPVASAPAGNAAVSPAPSPESSLEQSIRKKHKDHFSFTIGDSDEDGATSKHRGHDDDIPGMVVPLVGIIVMTVFGAPVLIVAVIMYFGFSKSRMQHRTIRMLVEKGQPVPPELLAPPTPAVRQRSDMRRGIVLFMVGVGLLIFLGAVNDWENGAWAIGLIPALIGLGYLMVWKLEGGKRRADNPPPLP
jgi:hypothetical protein